MRREWRMAMMAAMKKVLSPSSLTKINANAAVNPLRAIASTIFCPAFPTNGSRAQQRSDPGAIPSCNSTGVSANC